MTERKASQTSVRLYSVRRSRVGSSVWATSTAGLAKYSQESWEGKGAGHTRVIAVKVF